MYCCLCRFCLRCLDQFLGVASPVCPVCRQAFDIGSFQKNDQVERYLRTTYTQCNGCRTQVKVDYRDIPAWWIVKLNAAYLIYSQLFYEQQTVVLSCWLYGWSVDAPLTLSPRETDLSTIRIVPRGHLILGVVLNTSWITLERNYKGWGPRENCWRRRRKAGIQIKKIRRRRGQMVGVIYGRQEMVLSV